MNYNPVRALQFLRAGSGHANIELITVATDDITQREAIFDHLYIAGLDRYLARTYSVPNPERINGLINPHGSGETQRMLVIRTDRTTFGVSGTFTPSTTVLDSKPSRQRIARHSAQMPCSSNTLPRTSKPSTVASCFNNCSNIGSSNSMVTLH